MLLVASLYVTAHWHCKKYKCLGQDFIWFSEAIGDDEYSAICLILSLVISDSISCSWGHNYQVKQTVLDLKMGVPKFYRWLSERYPCLSEVVKEYQIPEFDNLYLDMNGIIHICSHPNDDDPHFRISEEKIFQDIFHYIEFLFRMVQPRKVSWALVVRDS